jgi:hypothetical protein
MLSGDHHALTRPPMAFTRPPIMSAPPAAEPPPLNPPKPEPEPHADPRPIPPMPPFPHPPEKGGLFHGVKFFAEVLWWALTAARMLFVRAPKWVRILLVIWLVTTMFSTRCSRSSPPDTQRDQAQAAADKAKAHKAIKAAAEKLIHSAKDGDKTDTPSKLTQISSEIARELADGMKEGDLTGKAVIAVPFALGVTNENDAKFLSAVFSPVYGRLAVERAEETGLVTSPLAANTDEALVALGQKLEAGFVLGGWINQSGDTSTLTVRLIRTKDASVAWTAQYPVAGAPAEVADQIANGVLAALPRK